MNAESLRTVNESVCYPCVPPELSELAPELSELAPELSELAPTLSVSAYQIALEL